MQIFTYAVYNDVSFSGTNWLSFVKNELFRLGTFYMWITNCLLAIIFRLLNR